MMSYYSIVSISSHSHLGERFNIGLLCINRDKAYFHFSEAKLKIIAKLFNKSAELLIKSTLESVQKEVLDFNTKHDESKDLFIQTKDGKNLSRTYLTYLSRYNNNLVQFTAPDEIDLDIDQVIFEKLFHKYIFDEERFILESKNQHNQFDKVYESFLKKAEKYVNTNFKVTSDIISGLITPKKVDMFGKNGSFNLAHSIDFSTRTQTLTHHLDSFMYLALSSEMAEDKKASCFLIGDEPLKESPNHAIWQNVKELASIEYVPFDEREKIIQHFKKEGVTPILSADANALNA
jgi:hypothetical protein